MSAARPNRSPTTRSISARRCSNSSLTLIEDNRLYYRGRDAAALARTASLEEVARLLVGLRRAALRSRQPAADDHRAAPRLARRGDPGAGRPLPRRAAGGGGAATTRAGSRIARAMLETGVRVLRLLTAAVTARPLSALPVHQQLAAAWRVPPERAPLLARRAGAVGRPRVQRLGLRRPRRRLDRRQSLRRDHGGPRGPQRPAPWRADAPRRLAVRRPEEGQGHRRRAGAARARPHLHPGLRPSALSRRRCPRRHPVRAAARDHAATRPSSPSPSGWPRPANA